MSPSSPAFTGSCCTLTGTDAASFQVVGSNLETSGTPCPTGPCTFHINLRATQAGISNSPFSQAETITSATGPSNTMAISSATGGAVTNYPFQFGRPFIEGAIPHSPQVLINGTPATTQADVKNRYPDGSVEFAVVGVVLPTIPSSGSLTLTFQDTTATSTPMTLGAMETLLPVGAAKLTLTPVSPATGGGIADAGQMLIDGHCAPWTSGPVAQTMICADDTATRAYDIGFGDGYHPFRPRFYVTFWPGTSQVYVRVVGENDLADELEDLVYTFTIKNGATTVYSGDLSNTQPTYPKADWNMSTWTKTFWIGGTPTQQVNIDNSLAYLESTRFIPNFDTTLTPAEGQISTNYANYFNKPHDIYDAQWDGGYQTMAMGSAGASNFIGPFPIDTVLWLESPDWRVRATALNETDLTAAWPWHLREIGATRILQRGDTPGSGTGLGKTVSLAGRPRAQESGGSPDNWTCVGTCTYPHWTAATDHGVDYMFPAYALTGDPWYLDELYLSTGWTLFDASGQPDNSYTCTNQVPECAGYRGPLAAVGGVGSPYAGIGYTAPNSARMQAWAMRARCEAAFSAPDSAPEKGYFRVMTNDSIGRFEGYLGINSTPFDTTTEKTWIESTIHPYIGTFGTVGPITIGYIPSPGNWGASASSIGIAQGYISPTSTGDTDDPWMNYYLSYALGRCIELGFPMTAVKNHYDQFQIGIISSPTPQFLSAYNAYTYDGTTNTQQTYAGMVNPSWYASGIAAGWVSNFATDATYPTGYANYVGPGLAMGVDDGVTGGAAAWSWWNTNAYSLSAYHTNAIGNPQWAIIPRTDANVLPAQSTVTPP